jgi:hypothetical protein
MGKLLAFSLNLCVLDVLFAAAHQQHSKATASG